MLLIYTEAHQLLAFTFHSHPFTLRTSLLQRVLILLNGFTCVYIIHYYCRNVCALRQLMNTVCLILEPSMSTGFHICNYSKGFFEFIVPHPYSHAVGYDYVYLLYPNPVNHCSYFCYNDNHVRVTLHPGDGNNELLLQVCL